MKKVLVIGAGRGQVPIIDLLHKYGAYVCVVSPEGNYPGLRIADEVFYEDVKSIQAILMYAKKAKITAIVTDQLDEGVLTSAVIAEELGLKGIGKQVARKFTDKYEMRQAAKKIGIAVPRSMKFKSLEEISEAEIKKFPLMMKPLDSAASKGVYKILSYKDITKYFEKSKSYSNSGEVILEEFIEGKEYVVDAYTEKGEVTNLIVGHREYFNIDNTFIPKATLFVDAISATNHIEQKIKEINTKIVKGFGLQFGITHGEYLYNEKEDEVYLVEIAARGGGVFISSDLIPLCCGVNANELLVRCVLGLENKEINLTKGAAAYFCYLTPQGQVCQLNNIAEAEKCEGVYKCFFDNIYLGMQTDAITNKASRKGPILVFGKNKEECYRAIKKVQEILDIRIQTQDGIKPIIWE